jgi:hypothetical protein
MQKQMLVVGRKNPGSKWQRFDRLQKTVQLLAGGVREPKGVHRFKTWEEFNQWKLKYQVQAERRPKMT